MTTIAEMLEGKTITTARLEGHDLYLHLGIDKYVIVLSPTVIDGVPVLMVAAQEFEERTMQ